MPHSVRPAEFQTMCATGGLHECMHVVYVCNVYGSFDLKHLQKRGFCRVTQQRFPFGLIDREHTHKAERERETGGKRTL